jgi:hypothetical protein
MHGYFGVEGVGKPMNLGSLWRSKSAALAANARPTRRDL